MDVGGPFMQCLSSAWCPAYASTYPVAPSGLFYFYIGSPIVVIWTPRVSSESFTPRPLRAVHSLARDPLAPRLCLQCPCLSFFHLHWPHHFSRVRGCVLGGSRTSCDPLIGLGVLARVLLFAAAWLSGYCSWVGRLGPSSMRTGAFTSASSWWCQTPTRWRTLQQPAILAFPTPEEG